MVDVALAVQPRARERHGPGLARTASSAGRVRAGHRAPRGNVDDPERLGRLVELLLAVPRAGRAAAAPAHARRGCVDARTARAPAASAAGSCVTPPLGYVELTALLCHARAVLTDSGGLQKEAYLAGVPCVTHAAEHRVDRDRRDGWNVLVDLDADAAAGRARARAAGRAPAAVRRRARRGARRGRAYTALRMSRPRHREIAPLRVGVAGLGYWGPNLARNFAAIAGLRAGLVLRRRPRRPGRGSAAGFPGVRMARRLGRAARRPCARRRRAGHAGADPRRAGVRVLEAGKHCFVEKPLAQSVADAERAVAAAARSGPRADGRPPARVPPRRAASSRSWPTPASSATRSTTSTATA